MMNLRDNFRLALTKLRTRPIRLAITLIISGLLFSVLILMSLFIRGTLGSLASFTKEGYFSRFIVATMQPGAYDSFNQKLSDPALLREATKRFDALKAQKTAEAKRLGIPYNPAEEPVAVTDFIDYKTQKPAKSLSTDNPITKQLIVETYGKEDQTAELKRIAAKYGALAIYESHPFYLGGPGSGSLTDSLSPIVDGKEQDQQAAMSANPDPIQSFTSTLASYDAKMISPMVFPGLSLESKAGEPVPIIAPVGAVEKLTGITAPSSKAPAKDRLSHAKIIREKARNLEFEVCYRNSTASSLTGTAQAQIQDIKLHQKEAGFVMPSQIYSIPTAPCSLPVVSKDTRTAEEKQLAQKQAAFETKFGKPAPVATIITFKIVGFSPNPPKIDNALTLEGLFGSVLAAGTLNGWITSREAINLNPYLAPIQNDVFTRLSTPPSTYLEMPSRESQRRMIDAENCQADCNGPTSIAMYPVGNPLATIYDASQGFGTFLTFVLAIVAAISSLIMMGTIGKVISDSRRETSVFRALGARRIQLVQLYGLYAAILGLLTAGVSGAIGLVVGGVIDTIVTPGLSINAVMAFNAADLTRQFHVIGFNPMDLAGVALLTVLTALVSMGLPLSMALRRDPVKDMRDET